MTHAPKSPEAERATLGAILLNAAALDDVAAILGPVGDRFTIEAHGEIYETMIELISRGRPVDVLTISEEMRGRHSSLLGEIAGAVPVSSSVKYYAGIVRDRANERALVHLGQRMIAAASSGQDTAAQLDAAEAGLREISQTRYTSNVASIHTVVAESRDEIRAMENGGEAGNGIALGIHELDAILGGWKPGSLNIVAARPSVGKTAFALNVAHHAAKAGSFVLFFSLEMSASQLGQRLISIEGGADLGRIRKGFQAAAELQKVDSAAARLGEMPIAIDDTPGQMLAQVRSTARRHFSKIDNGVIVVDYLQLMRTETEGRKNVQRYQEIGEISRGLKQLARELDAPVIACCQLGRSADAETDGFRMMAHLRESGDIEQDADTIVILSRPSAKVAQEAGDSAHALVQATVAKHRNGPTGRVDLFFDKPRQRFCALAAAQLSTQEPELEWGHLTNGRDE